MSVLVVLEQHRMSWEAFAAAQQFAQEMGTTLEAVVVASQELATQAATKKAAKIYSVEHPALTSYTADAYTAALEALVLQAKPRLIVATKSDKLSKNELKKSIDRVRRTFNQDQVVAYSAKTGFGREEVWRSIETAMAAF